MKKILPLLFAFALLGSCNNLPEEHYGEEGIPKRPVPNRLVNDNADILSDAQEKEFEKILQTYSMQTKTDIVIYTTASFNGFDKSTFAFRIIDTWGIGDKEKDNGLLILLKPKETAADNKGEVFIATGSGMEAAIPDVTAKRIIEERMIPLFKQQQYYAGLKVGVDECMMLASKEFQPVKAKNFESYQKQFPWGGVIGLAIVVLFYFLFFSGRFGKGNKVNQVNPWTALWFLNIFGSGRSHYGGGWGGGGWGGGSGGGGGWGGFGGGGSSGGGAGGSW